MVVIPGRDRSRAVIMADHYDTAYMEDVYDKAKAAAGPGWPPPAPTTTTRPPPRLMLAAPIFLEMSRQPDGWRCDVWLVHLTGEEFPADCMGARHLAQSLVEGTLQLRVAGRRRSL